MKTICPNIPNAILFIVNIIANRRKISLILYWILVIKFYSHKEKLYNESKALLIV